jgi:exo-beta-1,3-glucanase (GH17 family)
MQPSSSVIPHAIFSELAIHRLGCGMLIGLLLCAPAHAADAAAPAVAPAATLPGGARPFQAELDGKWIGNGVCFSPFRPGQAPGESYPGEAQVLEDLHLVNHYWQLVRMYDFSPVAETTLKLIRRHQLPMRVILGAWIVPEKDTAGRTNNRTQIDGVIRLANQYRDIVVAVSIGNETMVDWSDHRCEPSLVIDCIREARRAITQPVTTADDYNFWNKEASKPVAAEVDFITLHCYALWNGRQLDEAMAWTEKIYDSAAEFHPGKQIILGETGWATKYDASKKGPGEEGALMKGEVSVAAQENYLRQHYQWVSRRKVVTLLFEAFDESWKGGGRATSPGVAEKHWGVFDEERNPKPSFAAIIREFYRPAVPQAK